MSGDFGPSIIVPAALRALNCNSHLMLFFVGDPDAIIPLIEKANFKQRSRLQIIPAKSVITNNIRLSQFIRSSHGSSMRIAIELVKEGHAQACISSGDTGLLMGLANLIIKPIKGIKRPALVTIIPNQQKGKTVLLDLGANINCSSFILAQFAAMGSILAEEMIGIIKPRVALLNIGEEESKGLISIRKAAEIIKKMHFINYIGYIEANDLLTGKTDVLVCDGFIGNIMLKTVEGAMEMFLSTLKSVENKNKPCKSFICKYILKKNLSRKFNYLDPDQYNGACLLGLNAIVIKSHGAANQQAFTVAIEQATKAVQKQVPQLIASRLEYILSKINERTK